MTYIFTAKTNDAYYFKILIELLSNNIKTGHFKINEDFISLCSMDTNRKVLIKLRLLAENFTLYKYKGKERYLGINLSHLHKMLRSIKKKDSLQLFIDSSNSNKLGIKVFPKDNNRVSTSFITIQTVQELEIDLPIGYSKPVIISSSEFSKMLKDLNNIGAETYIDVKNFYVKFSCKTDGIFERIVEFGEIDNEDDKEEIFNIYSQKFTTEQLCKITKISGLSNQLKLYVGKPIMFKSNVGNLGEIMIFIKSIEEIDNDNHNRLIDG